MFVYREDELNILQEEYSKPTSNLICIIGRKNIGKTTLLRHYLSGKNHIYFSSIETIPKLLFTSFLKQISIFFNKKFNKSATSLLDILNLIAEQKIEDKLVIAIDDFQTLQKVDKNALKDLNHFCTNKLSSVNIQLIVSGSIYHSDRDALKLYKKSSKILSLESYKFSIIKQLLPNISKRDEMYVYASFGSSPCYLKYYNPNKDFLMNIKEQILSVDSPLFYEGMNILKSDLSDVSTYASIMYAIAHGNSKIGDIAKFLDVKSSYLTRYLQKLIEIRLISKYVPVTDDIAKSKFGRYKIEDKFLKFWFCYVYPNYSYLQKDNIYPVVSFIRKDFSKRLVYSAYRDYISELINEKPEKFLDFQPKKFGSWWNNKDMQIDIVAYDNKTITFIDCKWHKRESAFISYAHLKEKAENFDTSLKRKYVVFAKSSMPLKTSPIIPKTT